MIQDAGATDWIWVRHAPAGTPGRFCGQSNPPLDATRAGDYAALARRLPISNHAFLSPLLRAGQTLEKLIQSGFQPGAVTRLSVLAEQNFGVMEGKAYDQVQLPDGAEALAAWRPENGESFGDVIARVRGFLDGAAPTGGPVCVIAHAGVIRAALAIALDLAPARALSISVEHLSATALTRSTGGHWQTCYVNRTGAEL
jgi:alpha-ribazole phosphatase